ncbi:MAG: ABC transporter permease, partial [Rhodospirillaceae bacterium]|nr:ABC transporter permease [Rhodospirillaceae bacterium]
MSIIADTTRRGWKSQLLRHPNFLIGTVLTGMLILVALVSLVWTPHAFDAVAITQRMQGPSAAHWLGTDHFGRAAG